MSLFGVDLPSPSFVLMIAAISFISFSHATDLFKDPWYRVVNYTDDNYDPEKDDYRYEHFVIRVTLAEGRSDLAWIKTNLLKMTAVAVPKNSYGVFDYSLVNDPKMHSRSMNKLSADVSCTRVDNKTGEKTDWFCGVVKESRSRYLNNAQLYFKG